MLVIDAIDVFRAAEAGILAPLPEEALPTDDFLPQVVLEERTVPGTEKFGYNTISFNSDAVDPEAMASLANG